MVSIASSKSVKNLGVLFDQTLGLKQHITHICQSAFIQLRNIRCLMQYLSADALVTVAHAFINSRLDYCNSLLVGIPDNCCVKLQRVQNCTARLVTNTRKYDHIMPVLKRLYWLPVKQRIIGGSRGGVQGVRTPPFFSKIIGIDGPDPPFFLRL